MNVFENCSSTVYAFVVSSIVFLIYSLIYLALLLFKQTYSLICLCWFIGSKHKLFGLFRYWAFTMKVIPETRRVQYIWYLRFYYKIWYKSVWIHIGRIRLAMLTLNKVCNFVHKKKTNKKRNETVKQQITTMLSSFLEWFTSSTCISIFHKNLRLKSTSAAIFGFICVSTCK